MYEKCALVWPGLYIASNKTVLPTTILSLFFKLISLHFKLSFAGPATLQFVISLKAAALVT